jgi:hypothetical protein
MSTFIVTRPAIAFRFCGHSRLTSLPNRQLNDTGIELNWIRSEILSLSIIFRLRLLINFIIFHFRPRQAIPNVLAE